MLFNQALFSELDKLQSDQGAKHILQKYLAELHYLPLPEAAFDIDTPHDYELISKPWKDHYRTPEG
ncbi:MAG: hypothetical protein AB1489_05385 [Acidobacteriota bacterium]